MLFWFILVLTPLFTTLMLMIKAIAGDAGNWSWTLESGVCIGYDEGTIKYKGEDITVYYPIYKSDTFKGMKDLKVTEWQYMKPEIGLADSLSVQWGWRSKVLKVEHSSAKFDKHAKYVRRMLDCFTILITLIFIAAVIQFGINKILEIEKVQEIIDMLKGIFSLS